MSGIKRRDFIRGSAATIAVGGTAAVTGCSRNDIDEFSAADLNTQSCAAATSTRVNSREFNSCYEGSYLDRVAFPLGGMGAGMICLEGNGAISHVSVRNKSDVFNEPFMFAAISLTGVKNGAKVLEGQVPKWKVFGRPDAGNGAETRTYGFPRFKAASFQSRFPFSTLNLSDDDIPLDVNVTGWSPFIPGDEDNSSLPVAALEYRFQNNGEAIVEGVFSYHSLNFMRTDIPDDHGMRFSHVASNSVKSTPSGFVLAQSALPDSPHQQGDFAIFTPNDDTVVNHRLFRGGWFDARTIMWNDIKARHLPDNPPADGSPGASLYVPFKLRPGEEKTIPVLFAWYVPVSDIRIKDVGLDDAASNQIIKECKNDSKCESNAYTSLFYEPWYSGRFSDIDDTVKFWTKNYASLRENSELFSKAFYAQTLPPEIIEAAAANLTILKSPTILRQKDGRLWGWEGSLDSGGCCFGSCTHVWNYAQSIPHLFPKLERSLRETEYLVNQFDNGHQGFRAALPIRKLNSKWFDFYAAADGQLGGIMKVYREWRISADLDWLKRLWPYVSQSMDYCIATWDPKGKGVVEEPHHNTYDIEFWGPDALCTSFYLGALFAMGRMGSAIGEDSSRYDKLLRRGRDYMESALFNGEYFFQEVILDGLESPSPIELARTVDTRTSYSSQEEMELLEKEGPKYQYGSGVLSDGVLGCWIAQMCGLGNFLDSEKVKSHLNSVYKYNFKLDLSDHSNPQRPGYAFGDEGGLLLCSWPKENQPSLPFVYSDEVWTGIEYQVASHLMMMGEVEKGLDIVREVRKRYDGRSRNPFNEYECGHWYARAMSSYGLIQGLTGIRYDAVDQIVFIDSKLDRDFSCFLCTETGFALVGLEHGEPFINVMSGNIVVKHFNVAGTTVTISA